jgi:hypothetical protein
VKSAASGNYFHHLLLSWGNSHHRRKIQYIGDLILWLLPLLLQIIDLRDCFPDLTEQNSIAYIYFKDF